MKAVETLKSCKAATVYLIVSFFIIALIWLVSALMEGSSASESIPLFNLPLPVSNAFLYLIWATLGSIISILLFPRIIPLLYFKYKSIKDSGYKNAHLFIKRHQLTLVTVIKRSIMVFLLSTGLVATLVEANILIPAHFILPSSLLEFQANGVVLKYVFGVFYGMFMFILPLVVGLCSISWSMEDAGLMHYNLNAQEEEYFEIEPVFYGYHAIITGFAGISALFYYVGAVLYTFQRTYGGFSDLFGLAVLIVFVTAFNPAYLIYTLLDVKFLQKGLKKIKQLSEEDLVLEET
ncbi:MAG: hypothetical protein ACFFD4_35785 [Candidatus Odinarchaeota archaeon]